MAETALVLTVVVLTCCMLIYCRRRPRAGTTGLRMGASVGATVPTTAVGVGVGVGVGAGVGVCCAGGGAPQDEDSDALVRVAMLVTK